MSEEKVKEILRTVVDEHSGKNVLDGGMVQSLTVKGKKVSFVFIPPQTGCMGCPVIFMMLDEIKDKLNKKGYEVEVTSDQS